MARQAVSVLLILALAASASCDKATSLFRRTPLPDMGPRMPNSVRLTFDPAFSNLKMQYTDSCSSPHDLHVGAEVESVIIDAAAQNFQAVSVTGGVISPTAPDTEIVLTLQRSDLKLLTDSMYDRVPADLTLEALLTFKDAAGKELGQKTIAVTHNQRLILEPTQRRCDYGNIDEFVYDSGVTLAIQFIRAARTQLAESGPVPSRQDVTAASGHTTPAAVQPKTTSRTGRSPLSFKATLLDENSNLILEGGERVRVRVDVVNTGDRELQQVTASLTGSPALLGQFPTTTLSAGKMQPGQSRSLEFVATLPQSIQTQKAELHVTVSDQDVETPPPQTIALSVQTPSVAVDDVDHVPATTDFRRPHAYLLSIGIGSYRDPQLSIRRYGASDAEMVATYFQSLGGLPASNIRLLQDWKALRPDIDEALLDWLPPHMSRDAVVFVYFAGLATVSSAGEVFLIPYDGTLNTTSRAYPLKDLEAAFARLKAQQIVFFFDGSVVRLGSEKSGKATAPKWTPSGHGSNYILATGGLERALEDEKHRHGLFTYYLLRALRGDADTNRDGEVTLEETAAYLSQKVLWASKAHHNREQRPIALPPLKSSEPSGALVLSRLAAIRATTGQ